MPKWVSNALKVAVGNQWIESGKLVLVQNSYQNNQNNQKLKEFA